MSHRQPARAGLRRAGQRAARPPRPPGRELVLEITETSVIAEFDAARQVIEELRDLGIVVSIDDFGAGVTSLAYLSDLAVRELKLDRSFIIRHRPRATRPA